jgi:hypothetical protein
MWIEYCTKDGQVMETIQRSYVPRIDDPVMWFNGNDIEKPLTKMVTKVLLMEDGQILSGRVQVWLADVPAKKV